MRKVALIINFNGMWQGGKNYFTSLIKCFSQYATGNIELNIYTSEPDCLSCYQSPYIKVHSLVDRLSDKQIRWGHISRKFLQVDIPLFNLLKKDRIEVISHSGVGVQTKIPSISWTPDFQYKAFPDYWSKKETLSRDLTILRHSLIGNILVSSLASANDFNTYFPHLSKCKPYVLHFTSGEILNSIPSSLTELQNKYPIKERYIYLPNQFWMHKNHAIVLEALRHVSDSVQVVCTGKLEDYRNPEYVSSLLNKIKEYELEQKFLVLGTVPYQDVVSLMHNCVAVLNPSKFEGWSTSVEEGKSLQKKVILSDIPVHREQSPERSYFFGYDNAALLAEHLETVVKTYSEEEERPYIEKRQHLQQVAESNFVLDYEKILLSL
jgi:glycosyltransferase involved in cell wall biosynthesis